MSHFMRLFIPPLSLSLRLQFCGLSFFSVLMREVQSAEFCLLMKVASGNPEQKKISKYDMLRCVSLKKVILISNINQEKLKFKSVLKFTIDFTLT